MPQKFLYTARESFNKTYGKKWQDYIEWSKLQHLREVVGMDYMLNNDLVEPDNSRDEEWGQKFIASGYDTGLYKTSDYVLSKIKSLAEFNFLAVIVEPEQDCREILLEDYDFMGYELLDLSFEISALTNCGGFDESFLPEEINSSGLIDDFNDAYNIATKLYENNPEEHHANTNVIAIWRHKFIGKQ